MKLNFLLLLGSLLLGQRSFAAVGTEGGGGDATEARVNEIRSDILQWIDNGGAKELLLPNGLSYDDYSSAMTNILIPRKVIIGFVEKDDESDEELQVKVNGNPKTCRGFISSKDLRPHILCNISRFEKTSESNQYVLIHHEYAGLAKIEKNLEAASDYEISAQLTDYLSAQTVLRLAIKKDSAVVALPGGEEKVLSLKLGATVGCAITNKNRILCFKEDLSSESYNSLIRPPKNLTRPRYLTMNNRTGCVVSSNGIKCWGNNASFIESASKSWQEPQALAVYNLELPNLKSESHACALTNDGVRCTGPNRPLIPEGMDHPSKLFIGTDLWSSRNLYLCGLQDQKVLCSPGYRSKDDGANKAFKGLSNISDMSAESDLYSGCLINKGNFNSLLKCWKSDAVTEVKTNAKKVIRTDAGFCTIDDDNSFKCDGGTLNPDSRPSDVNKILDIQAYNNNKCVINLDKKLRCWNKFYPDRPSVSTFNIPKEIAF